MFSLIQFTDDLIYHVCKSSKVRCRKKNIFEAQWTNGNYYSARILAMDDNLALLNGFKVNLEFDYPRVVVLPMKKDNICIQPNNYTEQPRKEHCNSTADLIEDHTYNVPCSPPSDLPNKKRRSPLNFELIEPASKSVHLETVSVTRSQSAAIVREERSSLVNSQIIEPVCDLPLDFENGKDSFDLANETREVHFEYPLDDVHFIAETYGTECVTEHDNGIITNIDERLVCTDEENISTSVGDGKAESRVTILNNLEFDFVDTVTDEPIKHSFDCTTEENISSLAGDGEGQSFVTILNNVEFELIDTVPEEEPLNANIDDTTAMDAYTIDNTPSYTKQKKRTRILNENSFDRTNVATPTANYQLQGIVQDVSVDSARGKQTRHYFCIYCKKLFAKFSQHLEVSHKKELSVSKFMQLPPKSAERRRIIETIRRRGDFEHNTNPDFNTGTLFVARRSQVQFERKSGDYLPCPYCAAFFSITTLRIHVKYCKPSNTTHSNRATVILGRRLLSNVHPRASEILKSRIIPVLREDDCVTVIRYDLLVILLANHWCSKYPSQHHHDMIRSKMRAIGRLILLARSLDNTITDFASLLTPAKFDVVVESIRQIGGLDSTGLIYKAPTTVLTLSTVCKQAVAVWKSECIKTSNKEAQENAENFLCLFNTAFPAELGRTAIDTRLQMQRHKDVELPSKSDIQKLVIYLRRNRRKYLSEVSKENCSNLQTSWKHLASYTLVSMMVFNRRRPGELERITLNDYARLRSAGNITESVGNLRVNEDADLAKRYKRFEIRGKLNRTVPVLVNFEIEMCLNLIIKRRTDVNVPCDNPYVFGIPSSDHRHKYLRAYILIREYANLCGAAQPHLLRGTHLRKQIATECAVHDLSDNVIKDVANFMGHAIDIHDNIYRMPVESRDIVRMSQILEMAQGADNCSDGDSGEEAVDDISNITSGESSANHTPSTGIQHSTTNSKRPVVEVEQEICQESRSNSEVEQGRIHVKGLTRICTSKSPWKTSEKEAALKHFHKYLKKNTLPSLAEICEKCPHIDGLSSRSPTSIRLWLHNHLVKQRTSRPNSTPFGNSDPKCNSNPNSTPCRGAKPRWSNSMKENLYKYFERHFRDNTLPGSAECRQVIQQEPEYRTLSEPALKTAVANEQKRIRKYYAN